MQLPASLLSLLLTILAPPITHAQSLAENNASLLWGAYRPNLYLGIRPRVSESLLMGLMWGKLGEGEHYLRHTCEQNDGMASYGWTAYDARRGGTQTMNDTKNMIDITTEFVKMTEGTSSGSWGLRVRGVPREDTLTGLRTSVVFYAAMEGMEACGEHCMLEAAEERAGGGKDQVPESVDIHVKNPQLGVATIYIPNPKGSARADRIDRTDTHEKTLVRSVNVSEEKIWQSRETFAEILKGRETAGPGIVNSMIEDRHGPGNAQFVQLVFNGSFEFDVLYLPQEAKRSITPSDLTRELEATLDLIGQRFNATLGPKPPFTNETHLTFARSMISNLLGGLGYFHGDSKYDKTHAAEYEENAPEFWQAAANARKKAKPQTRWSQELLTHVPSRSVFPRGFLWDEGFHLLPVLDWDLDLGIEVLRSWLSLMDEDGWIAREQILGPEARTRVPEEFQVQYPHIANPPTLFWVVARYIDMLSGKAKYHGHHSVYLKDPTASKELLQEIYPLLKRHYSWWRMTQYGDVEAHSLPKASLDEGYRWRGRSPGYNYASGLDDYPRAEPPDITELHVDALAWVGVMADSLSKIADHTENTDDFQKFQAQYKAIALNIDIVHWNANQSLYCDTRVWESQHTYTWPPGYVSLFPFMLGFLGPEHPNLKASLDLMSNPAHLWTPYGIRSLSPSSTAYETGDNYWRSPIWINMNYLIIKRLLLLAQTPGPFQNRCRDIYIELRRNVVNTVYNSYQETGFAWEQYHPGTGKGQRTEHFTGWTALVVKIMAYPDLDYELGDASMAYDMFGPRKPTEGLGFGVVITSAFLLVFGWLNRRRIAGTCRSMRRR
ncbi:glycoside hydrolase [Lophiotrema nucula]|uniref:Mannosyl-oligosaccharide glucosidase n=1 Tax=Lophiotrema nucula TaxID=690887 RepID=A0A6A5ZED8_9PLEO|nr:glycoside hydrolase [Lophiotrema nucula]